MTSLKKQKDKYKVKLTVSFEYEAEVEVKDEAHAEGAACDMAMDYLDITLSDSQKFNQFWEYDVQLNINSIEKLN